MKFFANGEERMLRIVGGAVFFFITTRFQFKERKIYGFLLRKNIFILLTFDPTIHLM